MTERDDWLEEAVNMWGEDAAATALSPDGATPEAEPEPVKPVEYPPLIAKGNTTINKLLGLNDGGPDLPGRTFKPTAWHKDVRHLIVPPDDAEVQNYIWRGNEAVARAVWIALHKGTPMLLTGDPGTGKSSMVRVMCALLGRPFDRLNSSQDMELADLVGAPTVHDGSMEWIDGPLSVACRHGVTFLQDEFMGLRPTMQLGGYQRTLENNGAVDRFGYTGDPKDRVIQPHPEFRVFMTDNTKGLGDAHGRYSGTDLINTALLDRLLVTEVKYLPAAAEVEMLMKVHGSWLDEPLANGMVRTAHLIRNLFKENKLPLTCSPRSLHRWCEWTALLRDPAAAFKYTILSKYEAHEDVAAVGAMPATCGI